MIEDRITALERESRRWRYATHALLMACIALLICGLSAGDRLQTRAQAAETTEGNNPRFESVTTKALFVTDENGQRRCSIVVGNGTVVLQLTSNDGHAPFTVAALEHSARLSIDGDSVKAELAEGIQVSQRDLAMEREIAELVKRGAADSLSENDRKRLESLVSQNPAVKISAKNGAGIIDVFNPLKTRVVSVQSDKTNQGAVYVLDVNGTIKGALPSSR
jgi:hypothetical protein